MNYPFASLASLNTKVLPREVQGNEHRIYAASLAVPMQIKWGSKGVRNVALRMATPPVINSPPIRIENGIGLANSVVVAYEVERRV